MVMKKIYCLSMLAIAAMAAFSCAKVVEETQEPEKVFEPKVISAFTDDDVKADTKTSLSGVSVLWATSDNIKGYDGSDVHTSTATAVSENNKKAEFTFGGVSVEADLMTLAYPAEKVTNIDDDYVYATLSSTQTATASSFANQANLAIADGLTATPTFKNVGGLLSIIINNDNITSVKLSANESLTGDSKISTDPSSYAVATILSGKKYVILSGTIANGSEYYAVVYPGTYTGLKIEVTNTSGQVATYSNPNSLTVERNGNLHIATLTIPDGKWTTPTKGDPYTWSLASGDLGSSGAPSASVSKGTPSITWNTSYTWGDGSATKYLGWSSSYGVQVGAGSATNKCTSLILSTYGYTGYVERVRVNFTQVKDGGASVAVSVNDVAFTCGGNTTASAVDQSSANYDFTNASLVKGDVVITFTNVADKAFYIKSIEINPDLRTPQVLSFPKDSYSVELSEGTFAAPALTGAHTAVTYSSDDEDIATVDPGTGVVTLVAVGTCNITATAASDEDYQEGTASYELNVTAGPTSIADVIAASVDDDVYTSGVVAQVNNKGFIMTDGTDNVFVYQNATPSVVVGQAVKVRGTRNVNNSIPQIAGTPTITAGATGQSVTRTSTTVITSANAKGHTYSKYVSLSGTLSISGTYVNVSISGSTVAGSVYQLMGTESFTGGDVESLDGASVILTGYIVGSTNSYLTIAAVDIELDPDVAFLATTPADGSEIEWDDDEYGVGEAQTITIIQNGNASGYSVDYTDSADAWIVSDNDSGTITVYPKAANESTATDKTLTLTISHDDDPSIESEITLTQKKVGGPTWTRITSVQALLANVGETFIIGFEATPNSGVIVPMRTEGTATTSSAGIMYSGTTSGSSTNGTIDMSDPGTTTSYEISIEAGTADGKVVIKVGSNYILTSGNSNSNKLSSTKADDCNYTPTCSDDVFTFTSTVTVTKDKKNYNPLFRFNNNSDQYRFTNYVKGGQQGFVIYKKN